MPPSLAVSVLSLVVPVLSLVVPVSSLAVPVISLAALFCLLLLLLLDTMDQERIGADQDGSNDLTNMTFVFKDDKTIETYR